MAKQPNINQAITTFRKTAKQLLRTADIIQRNTLKGMKRRGDRTTTTKRRSGKVVHMATKAA